MTPAGPITLIEGEAGKSLDRRGSDEKRPLIHRRRDSMSTTHHVEEITKMINTAAGSIFTTSNNTDTGDSGANIFEDNDVNSSGGNLITNSNDEGSKESIGVISINNNNNSMKDSISIRDSVSIKSSKSNSRQLLREDETVVVRSSESFPGSELLNNEGNDGSPQALAQSLSAFEADLKRLMQQRIFQPKDLIIVKNTIGKEMYFLSRGSVEVVSKDGKEIYKTIREGGFFGELGVLFNVPRTASVRAAERCVCHVLTREALESVLSKYPVISEKFRQVADARMGEINTARSKKRGQVGTIPPTATVKMTSLLEEESE